jgi:hypothetical protein
MELLGNGRATPLHRKQGWLKDQLIAEGGYISHCCHHTSHSLYFIFASVGILKGDDKEALKQRVGYDYNNQLAFIEGTIPILQQLDFA